MKLLRLVIHHHRSLSPPDSGINTRQQEFSLRFAQCTFIAAALFKPFLKSKLLIPKSSPAISANCK